MTVSTDNGHGDVVRVLLGAGAAVDVLNAVGVFLFCFGLFTFDCSV